MPTLRFSHQAILFFIIPIFALLVANRDVLDFLLIKWLDFDHGAYNHGLLLLATSAYFLWKRDIFAAPLNISWIGLVTCLGFAALVFAANIIQVASVQVAALYFFIWGLFYTFYGFKGLTAAFWPLVLLSLGLPLWDSIGILLQKITLESSYFLLNLTGIPSLKEGFHIIIAPGRFEVAPSCSGLSYFLAGTSLAIIYAMMNCESKKQYFIVIAGISIAAILANWVRVYIVIVAGYFTDMQHSLVKDHFNLGWVLFGLFFILLLYIFNKWLFARSNETKLGSDQKPESRLTKQSLRAPLVISTLLFCFIGLLFGYRLYVENKSVNYMPDIEIIANAAERSFDKKEDMLGMEFTGAEIKNYQLEFSGETLNVYEVFYAKQTQGRELVQGSNQFFNPEAWDIKSSENIVGGRGEVKKVNLTSLSSNSVTLLYWYYVDGKRITSPSKVKIYELLSFFKGEKSAMAYAVITNNEDVAVKWLESF